MKRAFVISIIIALIAAPGLADTKKTTGAFLKHPASTVRELVHEVNTDPTVASRYTSYFHVGKAELVRYFRSELKVSTLKQPLRVVCCDIAPDGGFHRVSRTLAKGTVVFASANGTPVLWLSCGNPISSSLPPAPAATSAKPTQQTKAGAPAGIDPNAAHQVVSSVAGADTTTSKDALTAAAPVVETKVLAGGPEVSAIEAVVAAPPTILATDTAPVATDPQSTEMAALPEDMAAIAQPDVAAVPAVGAAGGGLSLGWLGALAGLGGGLAASLSGGHHSSVTAATTPLPTPSSPVPEPSSLLVLGSALSAAFVPLKIKRRSRD